LSVNTLAPHAFQIAHHSTNATQTHLHSQKALVPFGTICTALQRNHLHSFHSGCCLQGHNQPPPFHSSGGVVSGVGSGSRRARVSRGKQNTYLTLLGKSLNCWATTAERPLGRVGRDGRALNQSPSNIKNISQLEGGDIGEGDCIETLFLK